MRLLVGGVLLLLAMSGAVLCQPAGNPYGFEMREPKGWIKTNTAELSENVRKFELTDEALQTILKENNGSVVLLAYIKYDPKTRSGLIPVVQVRVRSKAPGTYDAFRKEMIKNTETFKQVFEEYELDGEPRDVEIAGIKSLLVNSKFIMRGKGGQVLKVRSRMYLIPRNKHFFQINFTDGYEGEDCSVEFDELVKTIRIRR